MRKILFFFGVIVSCTTFIQAWNPPDGAYTFSTDTRNVSISTAIASPTRLMTRESFIQSSYIVNNSTCSVYLSTSSSGMSFSTTFSIPGVTAGNTPVIFNLGGGAANNYWGDIWGVSDCQSVAPKIGVFRTK